MEPAGLESLYSTSNGTSTESHSAGPPTSVLFIFGSCALGALVRTCFKKVRLPYTVLLLVSGALFGILSSNIPSVQDYTTIASMDPHTILHLFLPVLVFESAFSIEAHIFLRSFLQIITLAIPGLALASLLTAIFSMNVFGYGWGWNVSLMFGSIMSATDPVAVVALLRELGASKTLATIIEGESLLNDGAAIVMFNVFMVMAVPGESMTATEIVVYFLKVVFGGPLFGLLMAKLTVFWLVNIFNDALTEITITLAATYLTFYIGEGVLDVSGVLAVVVLGVTLSAERTSISPEVEAFLHRFWEMLAYLANTLIFILVGVVITEKAIPSADTNDVILLISLYCALNVIRAVVIGILSPLLKRIGYGLSWQGATVMMWGGLRGAVGLALALVVNQNSKLDPSGILQHKVLLHTAGIVMLTLLINATTIATLLHILGMSVVSIPKRLAMASAMRNLQEVIQTSRSMYMGDRFLADADWDIVMKYIKIEDPYETLDEEAEMDQLTNFQRTSKCPVCEHEVPNEPSPKEYSEMKQEARLRMLKAEKTSYWRQFEHGMLSREAVRRLVECVDSATDREGGYIAVLDIKENWQIKGFYAKLKAKLEHWQSNKPDESMHPPPTNKLLRGAHRACMHTSFEVILYVIIMSNVVQIIWEIVAESTMCETDFERLYGLAFEICNYVFISFYIVEAVMKIMAFGKEYFRSKWNLFDFVILILCIFDIVIGITLLNGEVDDSCDASNNTSNVDTILNPNFLKIAKTFRLLRLLRSLRLVKGLIPQMIDVVNHQINKKLRLGYDVGKGYITGEEEVLNNIDVMVDNKRIAKEIRHTVGTGRLNIMKELGMLQKNHPGIAVSIKTQQASRRILNNLRDQIHSLRAEGVLDEAEAQKLEAMVEVRMKKLLKIPATVAPPPPEKIIGNLNWVTGDTDLIEYIKYNATLVSMAEGEELSAESDPKGGIYVVISGLVKVDKFIEDYTHDSDEDLSVHIKRKSIFPKMDHGKPKPQVITEKVSDYMSTGSILGEMSLLTGKPNNVVVTCDTSVQLYHIPYEAIQSALELFLDEPSLEYRLWRVAANRTAIALLCKHVFYREKMKLHLEKALLYLKKWDVPEGGVFRENTQFDLSSMYMSDIFLIHGIAETLHTPGTVTYVGPCHIPNKVEKLNLLPGRTDKHVILIVPRDMKNFRIEKNEQNDSGIQQGFHEPEPMLGSFAAISIVHSSSSDLCLRHASDQRANLNRKISTAHSVGSSSSLINSVTNLIGRKGKASEVKSNESLNNRNKKKHLPPIDKPKKHVTVMIPDDNNNSKMKSEVTAEGNMPPVEKPDQKEGPDIV